MRSRTPARSGIGPSLLDRILGDNGPQGVRGALIRDLEWLLNSRSHFRAPTEEYAHLTNSVYAYGLRDIGSYNATASNATALAREIRETIERFEPRLKNVTVSQASDTEQSKNNDSQSLYLVITGEIETDTGAQQVALETRLELSNGEYRIRGDRS